MYTLFKKDAVSLTPSSVMGLFCHLKISAILAFLCFFFFLSTSIAQEVRKGSSALIRQCEMLAASPDDRARSSGVLGVDFKKMDVARAFSACEAAVRENPKNWVIHYSLARLYIAKDDYIAAGQHLVAAAQGGHALATGLLGTYTREGANVGLPENNVTAVELLRRSVALGNTSSLIDLAKHYRFGWAVPQDCDKAVQLLNRARTDKSKFTASWALRSIADIKWQGDSCVVADRDGALALYFEADRLSGESLTDEIIAKNMESDRRIEQAGREAYERAGRADEAQKRCLKRHNAIASVWCPSW